MTNAPWEELERLLGPEGLCVEPAGQRALARPADTEQTAAAVRWAAGHRVKITVGAGDVGEADRNTAGAGQPRMRLDLARMRRLRFFEPGDLTAGWDAGATAAEVNATLAARGQFLPLDGGAGEATLGAILGAHRSGPLRHGFGTVRDFVIGVEAVTAAGGDGAAGQIVHGGGKVVKNVAGYDLMRLLIGSRGTLAVITGVNCKVFPALQATETVRFRIPDWAAAERLRSRLLHSPLRLIALEAAGDGMASGELTALARFQGSEAVRARYRKELAAAGGELGLAAEAIEPEQEIPLWAGWEKEPMPLRLGAPSGVAIELLRRTVALAREQGWRPRLRGRLGIAVFALALDPPAGSRTRIGNQREWNQRWRAMAAGVHPDAWLRDSAEPFAAAWETGSGAEKSGGWMRRLRHQLDPASVFVEAEA